MYGLGLPVENRPHMAYYYTTEPPLGFDGLGSVLASAGGAVSGATSGFMAGGPIGAVVGGAAGAILGLFSPSMGQIQATDATSVVNYWEPLLKRNVQMFLQNPTPETQSAAESVFMNVWTTMGNQLSQFGKGGQAGINDRAPGGKFDWWKAYLYPIQNYKFTSTSSASVVDATGTLSTSLVPAGGVNMGSLLLIAAVGFGIYAMSGGME